MSDYGAETLNRPLEVMVSNQVVKIDPPKPNAFEYSETNKDLSDLQTYWMLDDILSAQDYVKVTDTTTVRLETAKSASKFSRSPAEFSELLTPAVLGLALSITNEMRVKNKLSWEAMADGSGRPEAMLTDFFAGLHIEAAANLIGVSSYNKSPLFEGLSTQEREEILPYFVKLSGYTPRFVDSIKHVAQLIEKKNETNSEAFTKVNEIKDEVAELLAQERSEIRNQAIVDKIEEFCKLRSNTVGYLSVLVMSPFSYLGRGIKDSKFLQTLESGDNKDFWESIIPYWGNQDVESSDERYIKWHESMKDFLNAKDKFEDFAKVHISAALEDATTIGNILDRQESESDVEYKNRLENVTTPEFTKEQNELLDFLLEGYKSGEINEYPEMLLEKISELCGVKLVHADITPTQTVLNKIGASVAIANTLATGEARVYKMQTDQEVMRKRVLIAVPEDNVGFEWQFLEANMKSLVNLDESPEFLKKNGPINEMTIEQYKKFEQLMKIVQFSR